MLIPCNRFYIILHFVTLKVKVFTSTCYKLIISFKDLRYVDPNYVKLFQLAQMTIEYLLHTQVNFIQGPMPSSHRVIRIILFHIDLLRIH
jgi:hypothetical protein